MSFLGRKNTPDPVELDTSNIIGKGTVINGDVDTLGNIRIDGNVIGYVNSQAKIALGTTSEIKGDVFAQNAEIAGLVIGNIFVKELLVLKPSADIKGDIYALKIIVEAGAKIDGKIKVGEEPQKQAPEKHKKHVSETHGRPKPAQ